MKRWYRQEMTLPNSSFTEAKALLREFATTERSAPFNHPDHGMGQRMVRYTMTPGGTPNPGALRLVHSALSKLAYGNTQLEEMENGTLSVALPVFLGEHFPTAQATEALHAVRRELLSQLEAGKQSVTFIREEQMGAQSPYIEHYELIHDLLQGHYKHRPSTGAGFLGRQSMYRLPPHVRYTDGNDLEQVVDADEYLRTATHFCRLSGDALTPETAILDHTRIQMDGFAVEALYHELGVPFRGQGRAQ